MDEIVTEKHCGKCHEVKSAKNFYKASHHKDKLSSACKGCTDILTKAWTARNRTKMGGYIRKWKNSHLDQEKERIKKYKKDNVEKIRESGRKYVADHKEQAKERSRKHYEANKLKKLEQGRKYRLEHPGKNTEYSRNRRARKEGNGGSITEKEWEELKDKYGNKCLCCGRGDLKLTLDHVNPLVLGGEHSIKNAQPLCTSCNSRKNNKIIDYRPK